MMKVAFYRRLVVFLLALTIICSSASAQPGWRGGEGSTYQLWKFDNPDNGAFPDIDENEYGLSTATVTPSGSAGYYDAGWYESFLGRTGVYHGSEIEVDMTIPNREFIGGYKEIVITAEIRGDLSDWSITPDVDGTVSPGDITVQPSEQMDGWLTWQGEWTIEPNPTSEDIMLQFGGACGAQIDQVEVDTRCIPEPATLTLLATGLGLAVYRRRKQN